LATAAKPDDGKSGKEKAGKDKPDAAQADLFDDAPQPPSTTVPATTPAAKPAAKKASARKAAPAKEMVDLNSASKEDLMKLPGIGDAIADKIIAGRPYKNVDDLLRVSGMGPRLLERVRPFVVVRESSK
jgi:competence protein ComEA